MGNDRGGAGGVEVEDYLVVDLLTELKWEVEELQHIFAKRPS